MADRLFNMDQQAATPGLVTVDLYFTAGTSGAVPNPFQTDSANQGTEANAITSITKSTNDYIVQFDDRYNKFIGGSGFVIQASYSASGACELKPTAYSLANGTVTLSPFTAAGAAVALATGDQVFFSFRFKNTNRQ